MRIDTDRDMRADAGGRDMDIHSPTLRTYHQFLWSRPLPNGTVLKLDASRSRARDYLVTQDGLVLSSDSLINSMTAWPRMKKALADVPEKEQEAFRQRASSVAATGLWPKRRGPAGQSINQARGLNRQIADRLDLTIECVRRHYAEDESPLTPVLEDAAQFFDLWPDWRTWIRWWLLDDLVDAKGRIHWFLPFTEFGREQAWPSTSQGWRAYRDRCVEFIDRRAARMTSLSSTTSTDC
jgi:hypothetical protein